MLNVTHADLLVRKGRLQKLGARLQAAHDHMQARWQRLSAFLQRLAPGNGPGPVVQARERHRSRLS